MKRFLLALVSYNGVISHTKFWETVCYLTATFIIIKLTYMSQLTENYLIIYVGTLAARGAVSKFLTTKTPKKGNDE